ncbi:hypothetical protein SAMN05444365_104275 [Micromonospora pattaloongensis]|uniref:Uncharacterized protein n=1 Tax=Micromonospora pattaloongensis TaxID=405436 RepID=A0A1H3P1D8_9ACTN|nr:hypothetical protein [Micromonospora pattaloongensis]SDY94927.1 hypothetical protein SAMN05444365_104275 [Micromonospora pattaloongensis]
MPVHLNPDAPRQPQSATGDPGARQASPRTRWVPVDELSAVARALLSEDLGGRDVVPQHVADRVSAQAAEWVEEGFTAETVRPWKDADVPPAAAAYLARRGVEPRVLDLPAGVFPGAAPVALRLAIASGRLPVEQAYELLVITGEHTPPQQTGAETAGAEQPPRPVDAPVPRPVAPVLFSHAATDQPTDGS